jgi:small subunit ribosomal protein S6
MNLMTTQYELLYIIPATFTDEDVGRIEGTVGALLEKNGATIDTTTRLGKFKLAYPIKKVRHGHYMLVRLSTDGSNVKAIDEALRISSDVLRHLILRTDEAGGDKFDLVQFTEVNLDAKDEERKTRRRDEKPVDGKTEVAPGVAAVEGAKEEETAEKAPAAAAEITPEELEKKIDAAIQDNA